MTPQQEKLIKLIKASSILSQQERTEWLGLLDLMNDKQLVELEAILVSGHESLAPAGGEKDGIINLPAVGSGGKNTLLNKPESPGKTVNLVPKEKENITLAAQSAAALPKLSHIVNLPKMQDSEWDGKGKVPAPQAPGPTAATAHPVKPKSGFAAMLNRMFKEKELASGKELSQLELPDGKEDLAKGNLNKSVISASSGLVKQSPVPSKPLPPPLVPKPAAKPAAAKPLETAAAKPIQKSTTAPIKITSLPAKPEKFSRPVDLNIPVLPKTPPPVANKPQNKDQVLSQPASPGMAAVKPANSLNNLEDLGLLDKNFVQKQLFDGLLSKIKNLIEKYGYHQVVFKIEKSPAYQMYINTGLELLKKGLTFEQLKSDKGSGNFFDRTEFEKWADLLRQIQAG